MTCAALEALTARYNTVAAFWHDAYGQWQVRADVGRRTFDDCRLEGWGGTLAEAVLALDLRRTVRP